jgi:hypothetical protein
MTRVNPNRLHLGWLRLCVVEAWNEFVDQFDVEGLAGQLDVADAGDLVFMMGQNSGFYVAPKASYDRVTRITPSKCARRDLVADLAGALARRGIRLIVYLPAGAPAGHRVAREALREEGADRAGIPRVAG